MVSFHFLTTMPHTRHPRLGSDRGNARCRTRSNHQPASPGLGLGPPKGLTLHQACQRTFALLCVRTADIWWNNCYGLLPTMFM